MPYGQRGPDQLLVTFTRYLFHEYEYHAMSPPTFGCPVHLDHRSGARKPACDPCSAPARSHAARLGSTHLSSTAQVSPLYSTSQEPFAFYGSVLQITSSGGSNENGVPRNNGGKSRNPARLGAQGLQCVADQQQVKRSVPTVVPACLPKQPGGLPLAPIVEHSSSSTLDSLGSLCSRSCRFPMSIACNQISHEPHRHTPPNGQNEPALGGIQMVPTREQEADIAAGTVSSFEDIYGTSRPRPRPSITLKSAKSSTAHSQYEKHDCKVSSLKSFAQGLSAKLRSATRRSRPHDSLQGSNHGKMLVEEIDSNSDVEDQRHSRAERPKNFPFGIPDVRVHPETLTERKIPTMNRLPSVAEEICRATTRADSQITQPHRHASLSSYCHPTVLSGDETEQTAPPPWPGSHHGVTSSPEPFAALDIASANNSVLSVKYSSSLLKGDIILDKYAFDGLPVQPSDTPSPDGFGHAREASFTSTMSTSYSGTILGIDLDLEHDRLSWTPSRSAASPEVEMQREAHCTKEPVPPDEERKYGGKGMVIPAELSAHAHIMNSSVLPVLLPIAEALGIVRPNHATPDLSFWSPSGRLIQMEENTDSPALKALSPTDTPACMGPSAGPTRAVPQRGYPKARQLVHSHHHPLHHLTHTHIIPQSEMTKRGKRGCKDMWRPRRQCPGGGTQGPLPPYSQSRDQCSPGQRSRPPPHLGQHAASLSPRPARSPHARKSRPWAWMTGSGACACGRGTVTIPGMAGPLAGLASRFCFRQPWDGDGVEIACSDEPCSTAEQGCAARLGPRSIAENVRVVRFSTPGPPWRERGVSSTHHGGYQF